MRASTSSLSFSVVHHPPHTKWVVLFVFSYNTLLNGLMYMDFAGDVDLVRSELGVGNQGISWLYSASFASIVPLYAPIVWLLRTYNLVGIGLGVVCQVIGAGLRVLAWQRSNYALALLSSIFIGIQSAAIVASFVQLVERWFPHKLRSLATQIAIQANYAGWAAGTLLAPLVGGTKRGLRLLLVWQGVACVVGLLLFLAFYHAPPLDPPDEEHQPINAPAAVKALVDDEETLTASSSLNRPSTIRQSTSMGHGFELTVREQLTMLMKHNQFIIQLVCHSTLTGIAFAIPAVQDQGFDSMGFSPQAAGIASFVFITSGIVFGLTFGYKFKTYDQAVRILPLFYDICCTALIAMLALQWAHRWGFLGDTVVQYALTALMVPAGASSLAFLGAAMNVVVVLTKPVDELFSSAIIELGVQIMAAVLTQLASGSHGYLVLSIAQLIVTIIMAVFYSADPLDKHQQQQEQPAPQQQQHQRVPSYTPDVQQDQQQEPKQLGGSPGTTSPLLPASSETNPGDPDEYSVDS